MIQVFLTLLIWIAAATSWAVPPDQVMVYFPIAHSANNDAHRNVRYDLEKPGGWSRFVAAEVEPVLSLGVTTIMLHNPGGHAKSEGHMRFRQWSLAKEAGLDFVNDFTAAIRPLRLRGVDVVIYLGSPDDIDALLDTNGKRDRDPAIDDNDAWQRRSPHAMADIRRDALREVKPIRRAECRLGLDAVTDQGVDSLSYWLANREAAAGRRPIVEMAATKDKRHWWGFDQLILYRTFRPRCVEGTSERFMADWPQLGGGDWYGGTTYVMFRSTTTFNAGDMDGERYQLWRDAEPMVDWWNEIKDRDAANHIVPVVPAVVLRRLIEQDLLKDMR